MMGLLGVSGGILIISFIFSMLGQGGGMVYMPLFHWIGYDITTTAIPLGIILSTTAKLFSLPQYQHRRLIDWKGAWPMMMAVLVMAPLGGWLTPYVPKKVLLLAFAAMLLVAAIRTLWAVGQPDPDSNLSWIRRVTMGVLVAGVAAFIGGLLGIAGGFIISPMLMWIGYSTKKSVATTAAIATLSSLAGFAGHISHMSIPWYILVFTFVAAGLGSVGGSWLMANRAKPSWVKAMYGIVLIGIAGQLIGESWHLGNMLTGIGVVLVGMYLWISKSRNSQTKPNHLSANWIMKVNTMAKSLPLSLQDLLKPLLFVVAMVIGVGLNLIARGQWTRLSPIVEIGIFLVITAVMMGVRVHDVKSAFHTVKPTLLAVGTNFVVIPGVAWLLGWIFLRQSPDLWIGVVLYTLAPCIGWYLIFTDAAQGNVAWGAALLPWNLGLQIILMPVYVILLIGHVVFLDPWTLLVSVGGFFVLPFVLGWGLQYGILKRFGDTTFQGLVKKGLGKFKMWALIVVIVTLFASQPPLEWGSLEHLFLVIGVVFLFFILIFLLSLLTGHWGHLNYQDNVTLTFTTTARNSAAVIGIAVAAFPGHPLIYMAIMVGPLVELPVLLLLARLLLYLRPVLWANSHEQGSLGTSVH